MPLQRYEIKKYPNRRFYDVSRSRHVTLTDLYQLVRAGNEIVVTDSASGDDITNVVLTQIILEHDPPKMDLFPSSLLHQAIQANEQMIRKFIDQYFARAMDSFVQSRKQFDEWLKRSGFSALSPMAPFDWVKMLFPGGLAPESAPPPSAPSASEPSAAANADAVHALGEQLDSLRAELERLRAGNRPAPVRKPKRPPHRRTRGPADRRDR